MLRSSVASALAFSKNRVTGFSRPLFSHFMDIREHSARNAHDQNLEVAPGFVSHPARHVDHYVPGQFDLLSIEKHFPLAIEDVVNLIRALVVVQLGVSDLEM